MRLTIKQEKFCHAYMETGNTSEAYCQSYNFEKMKPETIKVKACVLQKKDNVWITILKLKEELKEVSNIKKEKVLYELEAISYANITNYVEFDGFRVRFKPFYKLTDQQVRAIESIKETKFGIELKLHRKNWTSKMIADLHGYNAPEKHEQMIHLISLNTPRSSICGLLPTSREGKSISQWMWHIMDRIAQLLWLGTGCG